jgi:hypothetical protein
LLKPTEKEVLKLIFNDEALDQENHPSYERMVHIILNSKFKKYLRNRTQKLLRREREHSLRTVLLRLIWEEFNYWDGNYDKEKIENMWEKVDKIKGIGYLSIKLDENRTIKKLILRFKLLVELPNERVDFSIENEKYYIDTHIYPWTKPLYLLKGEKSTQTPFDPSKIVFSGYKFKSKNWVGKLDKSPVRYFISGKDFGEISPLEYIERKNLYPGLQNLIMIKKNNIKAIKWLKNKDNYERVVKITNPFLKYGYLLFLVIKPKTDMITNDELSNINQSSITFVQGIKTPKSQMEYFYSTPPKIKILGDLTKFKVICRNLMCLIHNDSNNYCKHKELEYSKKSLSYNLPFDNESIIIPSEQVLKIEIIETDEEFTNVNSVASRSLKLYDKPLSIPNQIINRNKFGEISLSKEDNETCSIFTHSDIFLRQKCPYYLNNKLTFLGIFPGEIHEFYYNLRSNTSFLESELEKLPIWRPIWVIIEQRSSGKLFFNLTNIESEREILKEIIDALQSSEIPHYNVNKKRWKQKILENKKLRHNSRSINELWRKTVDYALSV